MPTYTTKTEPKDPVLTIKTEQPEEDSLESPIQIIENDSIDQYARDLAFMAEPVEVMILPGQSKDDTWCFNEPFSVWRPVKARSKPVL